MKFARSSRMLAIVGLISGPFAGTSPEPAKYGGPQRPDPRSVRLEKYFEEKQCPVRALSKEFLKAADRHKLDWRLLPSLAVVESGGGKEFHNNNIFGWSNGDRRFRSVKDGIHTVAERLANSRYYRNKPLDEVLYQYNPVPGYSARVKYVMNDLGPARPTRPVQLANRLQRN